MLSKRDWGELVTEFRDSAPYSHVVLDRFLEPRFCQDLRQRLLEHWGWRYKNWVDEHLTNVALEDVPEIRALGESLRRQAAALLGTYDYFDSWAVMQHRNAGLQPHADNAAAVVTLWLTPDRYNLDPTTGGLLLFDVRRTPDLAYHEFASTPWCRETYERRTRGGRVVVPYAFNRAVLFAGDLFHTTDLLRFADTGTESHRVSLTMVFDHYSEARDRFTKA